MGLGGNSIHNSMHNSSKQRRRWGQEMDNSIVTKEARKKLSQHRVQGSWNAMLASEEMDSRRIIPRKVKMGAMMGGSVGLIMGFIMDFLCRLEALSEQKDTPTPTKCGPELEELP
ncbi:mitochondrial genome maintenance protein Mgr2 [Histoplasma capsulatum var. duboisii H88]|uniref:Mitochondrial genome maintenance protein Mgr2 n=1 Tax=Ajellomyces capsulatus (strain H88) TaxID=544711 RepID=F0U6Z8_AJEC8|nr:mitochondrial genome maintenance protein Mgr2 [Histoplasma capsulatum var. duboisii H88]